ncbi:MAG: glycosyltransferase family 4 protein [Ardenticatenales bacterium]|nr:glycosyltransferase family 4 protein [Ardenticatenales bacterium]
MTRRYHLAHQEKPHIGLNAHLLALGNSYRSAGISTYIYQLLRHLPLVSDFRYTAWMSEPGGELAGLTRRLTPLPTSRPAVRILWEQLLQPYGVARVRPDLLHGMAFVLPLWLTLPAIATIYDLTFLHVPEAFRPLNRLYLRTMTQVSARRATHLCAIAEHGREDIARQLGVPLEKITVVYPGLDPAFATPPSASEVDDFRRRRGLPERFVLYVGTLEPRKNVPALIHAFAAIRRRVPGVKLVLAGGKGWGFDEIFAEVERLGLGDEVHFPGFVPQDELALWYAAAELFVYPSRYEGFGLPPLEAMACGTPVIVSHATSLVEVVGDAGRMVSPDDEEALAEAMVALLTDPSAQASCRAQGLAQAARFQWRNSAATQAAVYQRVLEG